MSTVVDFTPIMQIVVSLLALAATGGVTLGLHYLRTKLHLERDNELVQLLNTIAQRGISLAANRLTEAGRDLTVVDTKNEMVALAAKYLISSAPDAVKRFKLEDRIEDFIEARIVERPDIPTAHEVVVRTP